MRNDGLMVAKMVYGSLIWSVLWLICEANDGSMMGSQWLMMDNEMVNDG